MDSEACGERIAKFRRHHSEDRALDVPIAVQERMDLPEPAERVSETDEFAKIVGLGVAEQSPGVRQQCRHSPRHLPRQREFIFNARFELAFRGHPSIGERRARCAAIGACIISVVGRCEGDEELAVEVSRIG